MAALCAICLCNDHNQLIEPVLTSCGHLFCWPCLYRALEVTADHLCPMCRLIVTCVVSDNSRGRLRSASEEREGRIPRRPGQGVFPFDFERADETAERPDTGESEETRDPQPYRDPHPSRVRDPQPSRRSERPRRGNSANSGQRNLLQQSLHTFLDDTLSSALSPGFGQSASGGQGTSFQQSLTTLLDDTLNIALSSGAGQSASRGQGNSSRPTAASILPSIFEAFNLANNDQDDDTDDDTDDDNGQFHSYPTTPTGPIRVTGQTASEVNELVSKFPEIAESIIRDLLENNDYNVDKTIEDLLKLVPNASNASEEGTSPKLSSNSSVPTPTCTVCWDALTPPKRIFQCGNGHLVCGVCQRQPQLQGKGCPTCRQPMIGRATAMEQYLADLQKSAKSNN